MIEDGQLQETNNPREGQPQLKDWTVEDDLVLCWAVEEGASLEALSGFPCDWGHRPTQDVVRFSQRYSLAEVTARWRGLLYDPTFSQQAATRMKDHLNMHPQHLNPTLSQVPIVKALYLRNSKLVPACRRPHPLRPVPCKVEAEGDMEVDEEEEKGRARQVVPGPESHEEGADALPPPSTSTSQPRNKGMLESPEGPAVRVQLLAREDGGGVQATLTALQSSSSAPALSEGQAGLVPAPDARSDGVQAGKEVADAATRASRVVGVLGSGAWEDAEDELPSFSDVETLLLQTETPLAMPATFGPATTGPPATEVTPVHDLEIFRGQAPRQPRLHRRDLQSILSLERTSRSWVCRTLSRVGALACLRGSRSLFLMLQDRHSQAVLGRHTEDNNHDVTWDLGLEGNAAKVSRRQAVIRLCSDRGGAASGSGRCGGFKLLNIGRRSMHVNAHEVATGEQRRLENHALIEVGGLRFIFEVNSRLMKKKYENSSNRLKQPTSFATVSETK